jgi:hypothetical protein
MGSVDLAVSLVRSLFCGLPRQDKRMAVFVAASDETHGGSVLSPYHYAGWIAPEPDWSHFFAPAWQERVLDGPPKIPYIHMTEIRSKAWREEHGITEADADERLDEAARVIDQMGSLFPIMVTINGSLFHSLHRESKVILASGATTDYEPDFLAFIPYMYAVLRYVDYKYPDTEKVDFLVENNSVITKHIHEFYKTMPQALESVGAANYVRLLGDFLPAGKDRVPLQAADYLCWHSRRADSNTLNDVRDLRRWGTISHRKGFRFIAPKKLVKGLAEAFTKHGLTNEELNRIRSLRQHNEKTHERAAQRDKGRSRRGKSGEKKKKAEG